MRFLIDQSLSYIIADILKANGHDAVHVREYEMSRASDAHIMQRAQEEDRIVVTYDSDFGTLLALSNQSKPSVILLRQTTLIPYQQAAMILANLPNLETYLLEGCIATFHRSALRVRMLPMNNTSL